MSQTKSSKSVTVIGAGSWGCALAMHLARFHQSITIWDIDTDVLNTMKETGFNQRYLPDDKLPEALHIETDFKRAVADKDLILIVVPSHAFRKVLQTLKPHITEKTDIAWATKGIDPDTQQLLNTVVIEELGERPMAVISGPSFAKEVAAGLTTVVDIASNDKALTQTMIELFHQGEFSVYENHDFVSVQLGGALKNIVAVAVGMADGLKMGTNATSAIMTAGLQDICALGEALGGNKADFLGFSGVGDLILTCSDNKSRNRRFGLALGQGQSVQAAHDSIGQVVEGLQNTQLALQLAKKHNVTLKVAENLQHVLDGQLDGAKAIRQILQS